MTSIELRELAEHLQDYSNRLKSGEVVVLTENGDPVAELRPIRDRSSRLWELVNRGVAEWNGGKPKLPHGVEGVSSFSVSDIILQEREEQELKLARSWYRARRPQPPQ